MYKWKILSDTQEPMKIIAQCCEYDTNDKDRPSWVFYDDKDKFVADVDAKYVVAVIRVKEVKK